MTGPSLKGRRFVSRWRPSAMETLFLIIVILGIAWGLISVSKTIENRIMVGRKQAIDHLTTLLNHKISYGDISPSLLRAFEIRDLTILSNDNSSKPLVSIRRLRLQYSLARLVTSRDPISALRGIQLVNSDFTINLDYIEELSEILGRLRSIHMGQQQENIDSLNQIPDLNITGTNLGMIVEGIGHRLELSNLFFRIRPGDQSRINARGDLKARFPRDSEAILILGHTVETRFRVAGTIAKDLTEADFKIAVEDTKSSALTLKRQDFVVNFSNKHVHAVMGDDDDDLYLSLSYALATEQSELQLSAKDLDLSRIIKVYSPKSRLDFLEGAIVSGSGQWLKSSANIGNYEGYFAGSIPIPGKDTANFELTANGDDSNINVSKLFIEFGEAKIEFKGDVLAASLVPQGLINVRSFPVGLGSRLSGEVVASREGKNFSFTSDSMALNGEKLHALKIKLEASSLKTFDFGYDLRLEVSPDSILNATGSLSFFDKRPTTIEGALSETDLVDLVRVGLIPSNYVQGLDMEALSINSSFNLSSDSQSITLNRAELNVTRSSDKSMALKLNLSSIDGYIQIEEFIAESPGLRLHGHAQITEFNDSLNVASQFSLNETPYEIDLMILPGIVITGSGNHELSFSIDYDEDSGATFKGSAAQLPLPFSFMKSPVIATLAFDGSFIDMKEWSLNSESVRLFDFPFVSDANTSIDFGFSANAKGIDFDSVAIRDKFADLTGSGSLVFSDFGKRQFTGVIEIIENMGSEQYSVTIEGKKGGVFNVQAAFQGVSLERLRALPFNGEIDGVFEASGLWPTLPWRGHLKLKNSWFNSEAVSLEAELSGRENSWTVESFTFDLLSHQLRNGSGEYQDGELLLKSDYSAKYFNKNVSAELKMAVENMDLSSLNRFLGDSRASILSNVSGQITVEDATVGGVVVDPWGINFAAQSSYGLKDTAYEAVEEQGYGLTIPQDLAETGLPSQSINKIKNMKNNRSDTDGVMIKFSGGPEKAFAGDWFPDGRFLVRIRQGPYPLHGTATGTYVQGVVSADVELIGADAVVINEFINNVPLVLQQGFASGSARITGPLNDPDIHGEIQIRNAIVSSPISPTKAGPFSVEINLNGKQARLSDFAPEEGVSVPLFLTGSAVVEHWAPATFVLDIATNTDRGVTIEHQFGPLVFIGNAVGFVSVTGDGNSVSIAGEIEAVEADISIAEIISDGKRGGALNVAVDISTGRGVEFTWPSSQFPILRTLLNPSQRVAIDYDGITGGFSVVGDVDVRSGDLFYFDRHFRLRQGRIDFSEDQNQFDPRLKIRAETRERDSQGESVRITLEADTNLSRFSPQTVRLTSDPPRSMLAIDALLRDPLAREESSDGNGREGMSAAAFSGDILAQVALLQPVERALRKALGVDTVSIRSPFIQNLVLDGLSNPAREGSTEWSGNPLDNTSLSFGKYLGSDLFLTMLLRLDALDREGSAASPLLSDVELSLEWATPFVMLEWSFLPRNADTLFVTDNAISLRWGWSY